MAKKRALENEDDVIKRKQSNAASMAKKRKTDVCIEEAITIFHSKVKIGPQFVCTVCHCMMYRQTVVPFNRGKYTEASPDVITNVFCNEFTYVSCDGKQWVCKTCDGALIRGNIPLQAKANGLQLPVIPNELSTLNTLELRLISLRVPFMKMVALPSGKQRCIHGPAVNVPSNVDTVCTLLPCLSSETELIALKLKRKLCCKGHYMYDYISQTRLLMHYSG